MKKLGLYVHMPFCERKCDYCDFYSGNEFKDYKKYINALLLHMEDYSGAVSEYETDTIFIGGGTPSSVPLKYILELVDGIYQYFKVPLSAEFTIEANPATLNYSAMKKYLQAGINRLSLGCQSTFDNELAALGRIHNYDDFERSFVTARDAGFEIINVDLMYGIPEQTQKSFMTSLERICALDPEHISLYGLKVEDNTPFGKLAARGELILPGEDEEFEMYSGAIEYLEKMGYHQYEISNFAKNGYECRHNLKYWTLEEYLGLGPAAHSYFKGSRFSFKPDTKLYIEAIQDLGSEKTILDENYEISPSERAGEYIMLSFRLKNGIDISEFRERFGLDFEELYSSYTESYIQSGFMNRTETGYAFTEKGMFVSNYILSSMLDFDSDLYKGLAEGKE